MRTILVLTFITLCMAGRSHAGYAPEVTVPKRPLAAVPERARTWMRAMEATVVSDSMVASAASASTDIRAIIGWLGWVVATIGFFSFVTLQLKLRRYSRLRVRAGQPDHFLVRPTGNRPRFRN